MSLNQAGLLITVLLITSVSTACSKAEGPVVTRELEVPPFESIRARGAFALDVATGPEQKVTVTGAAEVLDQLKTDHELGRRLLIETPAGVGDEGDLKVTIVLPKLKAFYMGGSLSVSLRNLDQKALLLDVSGRSTVKAAGKLEYVQVDCTGMSAIDASMLAADRVEAATSGNCSIDVRVSELLTADLSGKSVVGYYGSPKNVKKTAGDGGSVVHRGP